ncbi:MAG: hypothetical protein U9P71_00510 [Campylobacterota bacterium]|nr:hypothetical protein [Campylobacterota bacterium]
MRLATLIRLLCLNTYDYQIVNYEVKILALSKMEKVKFSKQMFFGIPLSTQRKEGSFFFEFSFKENQASTALLVQTKLYHVKRLDKKKEIQIEL